MDPFQINAIVSHRENDHPGNQQKKTIFPNHLLQSSGADWPPKTNHTTHTICKDSSDPIKSNKLRSMWWNNQLCKLHELLVRNPRQMVFQMVTQNESTATKKLTKKVENENKNVVCVLFLYLCTFMKTSSTPQVALCKIHVHHRHLVYAFT